MIIFFRVILGILGFIGCVALAKFWVLFISFAGYGFLGLAYSVGFLIAVIGSLVYSFSGKYWFIPVLAIVLVIAIHLGETLNRKADNLKFCRKFAIECPANENGFYTCPASSDMDSFERTCNEVLLGR